MKCINWYFEKQVIVKNSMESFVFNEEDFKYIESMRIDREVWYRINQKYKRNQDLHNKVINEWKQIAINVE